MPEDRQRPPLGNHRSSSSHRHLKGNSNDVSSDSTTNTPPTHHKVKAKSHHVASRAGLHARTQSYGKLHKTAKVQQQQQQQQQVQQLLQPPAQSNVAAANAERRHVTSPQLSPTSTGTSLPKRQGSNPPRIAVTSSAVNLRKNNSHTSLKRNKSDVAKRIKSATQLKRVLSHVKTDKDDKAAPVAATKKEKTAVRFNIGSDHDDDDTEDVEGDGWTEASGSASPNLSRSASRRSSVGSGLSSAKNPASQDNSRQTSPRQSPTKSTDMIKNYPTGSGPKSSNSPHPNQITTRLLQRTPSHNAPPQMSDISATALQNGGTPSSNPYFRNASAMNTGNDMLQTPYTPHSSKEPITSRFIDSNNTNETPTPSIQTRGNSLQDHDTATRKVKSTSDLKPSTTTSSQDDETDQIGPLVQQQQQHSRKNSSHAYVPPQQSRTQQKLWLQRASSNMESQQISSVNAPVSINGFVASTSLHTMNPLVGYDARDIRVKYQIEKTGMEYLVVRRYQDPVGRALRRLAKLPGNERMRKIPTTLTTTTGTVSSRGSKTTLNDAVSIKYGQTQSLKERNSRDHAVAAGGPNDATLSSRPKSSTSTGGASATNTVGGGTESMQTSPVGSANSGHATAGGANTTMSETDMDEMTSLAEKLRSLWEQGGEVGNSQ